MNKYLIISWLTFLSVFLLILALDLLKGSRSKFGKYINKANSIYDVAENLSPFVSNFTDEVRKEVMKNKLNWAGNPFGLTVEGYYSFKIILGLLGFVLGMFLYPFGMSVFFAVFVLCFSSLLFLCLRSLFPLALHLLFPLFIPLREFQGVFGLVVNDLHDQLCGEVFVLLGGIEVIDLHFAVSKELRGHIVIDLLFHGAEEGQVFPDDKAAVLVGAEIAFAADQDRVSANRACADFLKVFQTKAVRV